MKQKLSKLEPNFYQLQNWGDLNLPMSLPDIIDEVTGCDSPRLQKIILDRIFVNFYKNEDELITFYFLCKLILNKENWSKNLSSNDFYRVLEKIFKIQDKLFSEITPKLKDSILSGYREICNDSIFNFVDDFHELTVPNFPINLVSEGDKFSFSLLVHEALDIIFSNFENKEKSAIAYWALMGDYFKNLNYLGAIRIEVVNLYNRWLMDADVVVDKEFIDFCNSKNITCDFEVGHKLTIHDNLYFQNDENSLGIDYFVFN